MSDSSNRRDFLKTSAVAAGAAVAAQFTLPQAVYAAGGDSIRVGLVGCGGRGSGAAENVLSAAAGVEIIALGDIYGDHVKGLRNHLTNFTQNDAKCKELGNKATIPDDHCHVGLDAYEKVINTPGLNYVMLATPPGFRPIHIQAAIAAGKNLFTEKPVGVDGPGIRKVLDAYEEAKKKGLGVAAGTQRRHQAPYIETIKQLHDGVIGDVVGARSYWNQGILWKRARKPNMSDAEYQINNWYGFTWLSGDHIVEQHVHNLDVINWAFNAHPVKAVGMGYRTPRDEGYGSIFNFFAIDYEYPKGVHALSMCRQISNCWNRVGEDVVGTKGTCHVDAYTINGQRVAKRDGINPYVQEHTDLIESIRSGKPINELKQVAESTLTAIMGRMSAYTGKDVTWEKALNSKEELMPKNLTWDASLPTPKVAEPGKTPLV
jgi:myo-inositol 2-dehydrogenase/D-chiro-inositol 1-dehydrogenase